MFIKKNSIKMSRRDKRIRYQESRRTNRQRTHYDGYKQNTELIKENSDLKTMMNGSR